MQLEPNEEQIGKWTILYRPPEGGTYNGKLVVTNTRLIYDAQFDMGTIAESIMSLMVDYGDQKMVTIPKERIENIKANKSFFKKKIQLTLDDGSLHEFDYGMLNIDKVVAAIEQT